jgi:hypothetical protein
MHWFSSLTLEWQAEPAREYESAALALMRLLETSADAVVTLAESSIEQVPAALAVSRSCLESGLTCAWLLGEPVTPSKTGSEEAVLRRWLGLHDGAREWMTKVAREAVDAGFDDAAARWHDGARRRAYLIETVSRKLQLQVGTAIRRPSVVDLSRRAGLSRLYHGYRLSSQFTHGTLMGAEEFAASPARDGIPGPWAEDWLLPLSMVTWGFRLSAMAYTQRPRASGGAIDASPLHDAAEALGLMGDQFGDQTDSARFVGGGQH